VTPDAVAAMCAWSRRSEEAPVRSRATEEAATVDDLHSVGDDGLVAAFVAGRADAFDVIVLRHRRTIYQLSYRFTGNHEDAADLTQDVFVRVFRGLARFKGDSTLKTWLHRVAVNTALNRRAGQKLPTEPLGPMEPVDVSAPDPVEALAGRERAQKVRTAIRQLPPKQQAAVILRVYQELSHEQIARALDTTAGAVKANLFHALGNLKRLMNP
jgi:RNA polymerase sigma-70 factor (ECF subfamily)